jgi:hypothetical protein
MLRNKPELLFGMKTGKISVIIFFIMFFSFVFFASLVKFGIYIPSLSLIYLLFFEGTIIFLFIAITITRNRSFKF